MKQDSKRVQKGRNAISENSGFKQEYLWLPLILLLTGFAYSNSLHNAILNFDDIEYFTMYPEVLQLSWKNMVTYFSKHYVLMYQPLPILTFALNYHFSQMNTFPMHLINLFFHLANIILIYRFVFLLRGNKTESLLIALVFAIHPMNAEAVSWISARSSSMYVFFFLLAINNYILYIKNNFPFKRILFTGLFFLLSLLSKAQAVTLPLVLVLLDYLYERKLLSGKVILEKAPFFVLSLVFGLVALADKSTQTNLTEGMLINYNVVDVIFLVSWSFAFYLFKFIIPVNLCSVYVYPAKTDGMLPMIYYLSLLVPVVIIWLLYRYRKDRQFLFAAGFFFFIISINIQLIPSRLFIVTERYGYLPYVGLMLIVSLFLIRWKERNAVSFSNKTGLLYSVAAIIILVFSIGVYGRNKVWANDLTLMDDIIAKNDEVPYLYRAYGIRGLQKINNGNIPDGINDFTKAIEIYPADGKTYVNRALAYSRIGNNAAAVTDLDTAAIRNPKQPEIFSYRSIILYQIGKQDQAWIDCNKCLELDSNFVDCYVTRGTLAFSRNDADRSIADFTKAIQLQPTSNVAYKNRGQVYVQRNQMKEACADFLKAAEMGNSDAFQLQQIYCK